jgi:hypothetical protein
MKVADKATDISREKATKHRQRGFFSPMQAASQLTVFFLEKKSTKRPTEQTTYQLSKRLLLSSDGYQPADRANDKAKSLDRKRQSNRK